MSTITITYTPLTDVPHRICYRKVGDTDYCCLSDVTSVTIGVPKDYIITVGAVPCSSVPVPDTESCFDEEYEGYVQPLCMDETDTASRTYWSTTYTITPSCLRYTVTCLNGGISEVTVTNCGFGYDVSLSPISVLSVTGTGTLADADAIVGTGSVVSVTIVDPGTGYTPGTYTGVDVLESAVAIGGKVTIIVEGDGTVSSVTVTTPDTGYTNAGATLDVTGIGPGIDFDYTILTDYRSIKSVTITVPGSGYESYPTIVLPVPTLGSPVQATADITGIEDCPTFDNTDCIGNTDTVQPLTIDTSIDICQVTPPTPGSEFLVVEGTSCCGCNTYNVTTGDDPADGSVSVELTYTDCDRNLTLVSLGWNADIEFCAITGSLYGYNPDNVVYVETTVGACI